MQIADSTEPRPQPQVPSRRPAFTLFELIVAIALSATLLVLIGSAISLYLLRVDASRNEVEQSQLARNVLAMIAVDIRATSVYQTQDISAITLLSLNSSSFDVDSIGQAGTFRGSALTPLSTLQTKGTQQAANGQSASSSSSTGSSGSGSSGGSGSNSSGSDSSNSSNQSPSDMVPGLNGSLNELILDVNRLPRTEVLFPPGQQPTATSSDSSSTSAAARPTDGEAVHYFVRQGNAVDPSDIAATSLGGASQQQAGGLVRQTIDQAVRTMAEAGGSSDVLNTGQVLIAPEVVHIEFQYYDGSQGVDTWNMQDQKTMPTAVEVRIWLAAGGSKTSSSAYSNTSTPTDAQMYSETIDLPLAAATGATASANSSNSSSDSNSNGSSTTGGSGQSPSSPSTNPTSKTNPTTSSPTQKTPSPNVPGQKTKGR